MTYAGQARVALSYDLDQLTYDGHVYTGRIKRHRRIMRLSKRKSCHFVLVQNYFST